MNSTTRLEIEAHLSNSVLKISNSQKNFPLTHFPFELAEAGLWLTSTDLLQFSRTYVIGRTLSYKGWKHCQGRGERVGIGEWDVILSDFFNENVHCLFKCSLIDIKNKALVTYSYLNGTLWEIG